MGRNLDHGRVHASGRGRIWEPQDIRGAGAGGGRTLLMFFSDRIIMQDDAIVGRTMIENTTDVMWDDLDGLPARSVPRSLRPRATLVEVAVAVMTIGVLIALALPP